VADPEWLRRLVERIWQEPDVGMCASKILVHGTHIIDKAGHLMYPDGQNRGLGTGELDGGQFDHSQEALFPDGCAALYRREAIEQAGGFDPYFFAYADDADLGVRCQLKGWSCLYEPQAVVQHHRSSTSGAYSPEKIYLVERNRLWLAMKSFPWLLLAFSPLLTANRWAWNLLAALMKKGAAGNFRRQSSLVDLLKVLFRAYRDGFRGLPLMLKARKLIRRDRRMSDWQFYGLLWRFRISARRLAMQDITQVAPKSVRRRPMSSLQRRGLWQVVGGLTPNGFRGHLRYILHGQASGRTAKAPEEPVELPVRHTAVPPYQLPRLQHHG